MGIALDAPGHATWFNTARFVSEGSHDFGTVHLRRERVISGRVKDAQTGLLIPDVGIRYASSRAQTLNMSAGDQYPIGWWATSDENGRFVLSRLPEGRVYLEMLAIGHPTNLVELRAGVDHLDIELGGGATIEGSLLLADGTPVDGSVTLRRVVTDRRFALRRQVDPEGRFRFEGLAAGPYLLSARTAAGVVERRSVTIANDELETVELLAEPLGLLSGRISGLGEAESASISIRSDDEWGDSIRDGPESFGSGRFAVSVIPDGAYAAEARVGSRSITRKLVMAHGEAQVDFDFAGRSRVSGRVLAGTRPMPSVPVHAVPNDSVNPSSRTWTDEHGRYEILGLAAGGYELRVPLGIRGSERSFGLTVTPDTNFDIRLGPFMLSGTVVAPPGASFGVMNWVVQARLTSPSDEAMVYRGFTDIRGVYRFDGLEEGEYTVSLAHPHFPAIRRIAIAGASVEDVDLVPIPSDTQAVRVFDAKSKEHLDYAFCKIEDGVWAGIAVHDLEDGLPTSLNDANLTCTSRGYKAVKIRWDGEPLEIPLIRDTP